MFKKYWSLFIIVLAGLTILPWAAEIQAQTTIPDEYRGDPDWISRGVMNGNLIETNYRNTGEMARWGDIPHGIWPRSIGGRHIDGIGLFIVGKVPGEREKWQEFYPGKRDTTLSPVAINFRDTGQRRSPSGDLWSMQPVEGFLNRNRISPISGSFQRIPAISNDSKSWPDVWPDKLNNPNDPGWSGSWNGLFGKGILNADLESYYVLDDLNNRGYQLDPETGNPFSEYGVYYPDPTDSTKGGLGLQIEVRLLQWANVLAEDVMFMLYRISNVGQTQHDSLFFAQGNDYGLGGDNDETDDNAAFNAQLDIAYGWDSDGLGELPNGGSYDVGYTGFAFLESPAAPFDGLDNDEDGIADERRDSGAGMMIEGQSAIRTYIEGNYDVLNFERFYGPIEQLPAYQAGLFWTGDENGNWTTFDDANNNDRWDPGEFLNDDTGVDGLGPNDLGYNGPDFGEADGIPQEGERDFDRLDINESDQIGLTGFELGIRSNYENTIMAEDQFIWESVKENLFGEIGKEPEVLNNNEPFIMFTSGPVVLPPGVSDYFSLSWLFGENESDFFKNRITVQNIYDANYNFAQPPFAPTLTAIAGDGKVTLGWDSVSVASFDRFTQEFDFEGYRLYKGTNNILSDARTITDVNGTPTFYKPLAQWDLVNGVTGTLPVLDNTASYDLGDDTGLQFFYVDEDVTNGVTYYYALVAYDRGVVDSTGKVEIDPQENVFNFGVDQFFNLTGSSQNARAVTPRAKPAGYIESGTEEDLSSVTGGVGTGSMSVTIVDEEEVNFGDTYKVQFQDSADTRDSPEFYTTAFYDLINMTRGDTLLRHRGMEESSPVSEGIILQFQNDLEIGYDLSRSGWIGNYGEENEQYNFDPRRVDGYETNWVAEIEVNDSPNGVRTPDNFELRWSDEDIYYPPRFQTATYLRDSLNVIAVNLKTGELAELLILDHNENEEFDYADELIIMEQPSAAVRLLRHNINFRLPAGESSVPPGEGEVLRIANRKPFATGDFFQFTTSRASVDEERAADELKDIKVVPNPYLSYSLYEPRVSSSLEGRGERKIKFINLPQKCTIRIFNVRGETIQTLEHNTNTNDGDLDWDLRTKDGLDLAYGVYVYHVKAPGIGEMTGKFAIVK
ncbi:hypothetical protein SAMN06265219_11424 [Gracilimonas mengyeensis]|uniref:Uncharacterized protein n=2 Tax=Gracilimonas mengyeensis TaxID=1302730 RepID=A0A521EZ10_9BACT|nr:hypothetical protein SAMN06265219_11424 [Gracilimonas mengyeensis]